MEAGINQCWAPYELCMYANRGHSVTQSVAPQLVLWVGQNEAYKVLTLFPSTIVVVRSGGASAKLAH